MIIARARVALVGLVLGAALAGCSGTPERGAPQPAAPTTVTSAPTTAAAADAEAEIRAVYDRYNQSLVARDFATTCGILTEEAAAKISAAIESGGGPPGLTCVEAFEAVYEVPEAAAQLDDASRGIRIESVEVAGDTATVTYGGTIGGTSVTGLKSPMKRIGGSWRVEGAS